LRRIPEGTLLYAHLHADRHQRLFLVVLLHLDIYRNNVAQSPPLQFD